MSIIAFGAILKNRKRHGDQFHGAAQRPAGTCQKPQAEARRIGAPPAARTHRKNPSAACRWASHSRKTPSCRANFEKGKSQSIRRRWGTDQSAKQESSARKGSVSLLGRRKPEQVAQLPHKIDGALAQGKTIEDLCREEQVTPKNKYWLLHCKVGGYRRLPNAGH
jgi:hypothetical protein